MERHVCTGTMPDPDPLVYDEEGAVFNDEFIQVETGVYGNRVSRANRDQTIVSGWNRQIVVPGGAVESLPGSLITPVASSSRSVVIRRLRTSVNPCS